MKGLNLFYLRDIAQQYASGMELYPAANEEDKKKIFADLLKFSRKIGHPISSNEDFQEIKLFCQTTLNDPGLSSTDRLTLKLLEKDLEKYYPKMGTERLQKKQTAEAEKLIQRQIELKAIEQQHQNMMAALFKVNTENLATLKQEQTTEKTVFNKMRNIQESVNTSVTSFLDGRYISDLRGSSFNLGAIEQLRKIESLIDDNPNHGITKNRLSITEKGIVLDGYVIPSRLEDLVRKSYKDIKNNPNDMLHPGLAQILLNFFGKLTNQPITRVSINEVRNNETGGKEFINKINTPANKETIKTIAKVLGFSGTIPMYICGEKIIRMDISQNGECGFSYHDSKDITKHCIVPLAK